MVVYKSKMTHSKGEGGKKNFAVYPACDFIAAITQHIPEKRCQMVRYYGWYSNKMRGERRKLEEELTAASVAATKEDEEVKIVDVSTYKPRRIPTPTWRECIKKIWEVDPLECPHCKAEMKIISFISEPKLVRKILEHLKFYVIEINDNPNIDSGVEDAFLREELYLRIMRVFLRRIEHRNE